MAGNSLTKTSMDSALIRFSKELRNKNIEHFVFFGTLLGLIREGRPITGDDDVDFYVNEIFYDSVCELLDSMGLIVDFSNHPNHTKHFIQVSGRLDKIEIRVDFYFYDASTDDNFLLEPWNFSGSPDNENKLLKLPKPLVFPLKVKKYLGTEIFVPQFSEIVCEFLYGKNWTIPKTKKIDYRVAMVGGRPVRIQTKKILIRILSYLALKFID